MAIALGGCASASASRPSAREQAGAGQLGPAFLEWTGKFKTTLSATSTIEGSSRNVVHGDVRLTAIDQNMLRAQITFSADQSPTINDNLRWSLSSGECRSNSIPLLPVSEFPAIAVSNNRGSLDVNVNVPLPTTGRYHVNVFRGNGADEADVLTCAELALDHRH